MESILTKYLIRETGDLKKQIDQLKKELVQDVDRLTISQLLHLRYTITSKEDIYEKMLKHLAQSFDTLGDFYLYVQATLETWKGRNSYTVKEQVKHRLSRDSSLYPIVNNFKALDYSFVD